MTYKSLCTWVAWFENLKQTHDEFHNTYTQIPWENDGGITIIMDSWEMKLAKYKNGYEHASDGVRQKWKILV